MFQYDFMIKAFIAGLAIAVATPCVGVIVVLKRFSMIGDTLSHA
jgi:zinc transport system permease protein